MITKLIQHCNDQIETKNEQIRDNISAMDHSLSDEDRNQLKFENTILNIEVLLYQSLAEITLHS